MADEIARELAKLRDNSSFVSPVNFLQADKYEREGVRVAPGTAKKPALTSRPGELEYIMRRGDRTTDLAADPGVTKVLTELQMSERKMVPPEPTLATFMPKERKPKPPKKGQKSQVGALQRMSAGPMASESQRAFEWSEELAAEFRGRDASHSRKRDQLTEYNAEMAKWKNMEKAMGK